MAGCQLFYRNTSTDFFYQFGLAKTILQGIVKGKRRGRQKKRWEDNIKEWTGKDFVISTRELKTGLV